MVRYDGRDNSLLEKSIVVTIGSFDGMHIGHRSVVKRLASYAREHDCLSMVVTLSPHPRVVLRGDSNFALIYSDVEKSALLDRMGIDYLYNIEFNRSLSQLTAEEFIKEHLAAKFRLKAILMGYNNFIGSDRAGIEELKPISKELNFNLIPLEEESIQGDNISSTTIRELITRAEISKANKLLGDRYFIVSDIVSSKVTRLMNDRVKPMDGSYRVVIQSGEEQISATLKISGEQMEIDRYCELKDATIEFVDRII